MHHAAHALLAAATVSGEEGKLAILAMSQRHLPAQLSKLPSSRKGKKKQLIAAELRAKKPRHARVELSLKQKCVIIEEAKI